MALIAQFASGTQVLSASARKVTTDKALLFIDLKLLLIFTVTLTLLKSVGSGLEDDEVLMELALVEIGLNPFLLSLAS